MSPQLISLIVLLLSFIISILFAITFYIYRKYKKESKGKADDAINAKKNILDNLAELSVLQRYFDEQRLYLSKSGANYMYGAEIKPVYFLLFKIIFAVLFFVGSMSLLKINFAADVCISFIAGIFGFKVLNLILGISNSSDNDDMLRDIKTLYDTLKIQANAGVFITQILQESYLFVKNKRLKAALQELHRTIVVRNDIEYALEEFEAKFNNSYIDMFCMTIEQSLQTGQSAQMLSDISNQMADVEHSINIEEKDKLENKILLVQLAIYGGILAATVYVLALELGGVFTQM